MCTSPITVFVRASHASNLQGSRSMKVPCGKCLECTKKRQTEWYIRSAYELSKSPGLALFVTLTYNENSVPFVVDEETGEAFNTVFTKDLSAAIKRFRTRYERKFGKRLDLRYFFAPEYGPRTLRPHYHGLVIGVSYEDFIPFMKDWREKFGFTCVSPIDPWRSSAPARYVAKYAAKGDFENPRVSLGLVYKPKIIASKGFGSGYLDKMAYFHNAEHLFPSKSKKVSPNQYSLDYLDAVLDCQKLSIDGFTYSLPRYYKKKLYAKKALLSAQLAQAARLRFDELYLSKLGQVLSDYSPGTPLEIRSEVALSSVYEEAQRERKHRDSLKRQYNKSKL